MNDFGSAALDSVAVSNKQARQVFNIRDFAAPAGDDTSDTRQLQAAIDTAGRAGGGTVRVTAGVHRVGTIQLRSGVTLQLDKDAVLLGLEHLSDYPPPAAGFVDAVGQPRGRCLIYAQGLDDVAIEGEGTIDGRGARFTGEHYAGRPFLVRFVECTRVRVQGITLRDAAAWVFHLEACDHVLVDGVTIRSRANHNNDGIDIDSCSDVIVRGCDISTGDDAICLKATRLKPCERITVEQCRLSSACGAIKLGTESYGDFSDILIRDCEVYDTGLCAIKIISTDGGVVERVKISGIEIRNTTGPIFVRLGDRCRTYGGDRPPRGVGRIEGLTIEHVRATVSVPLAAVLNPWTNVAEPPAAFSGMMLTGLPGHPLRNVRLADVQVEFAGGQSDVVAMSRPAEQSDAYPEHFYFGVLPAWALYARHIEGLDLQDVAVDCRSADGRPSLVCDNVVGLNRSGWVEP